MPLINKLLGQFYSPALLLKLFNLIANDLGKRLRSK